MAQRGRSHRWFRDSWLRTVTLAFGLLSGACASSRGEVDVRVVPLANAVKGPAVAITRVSDHRRFEIDPDSPSTPSLLDDAIHDAALTARAIARKRNGFGKAMGDILLSDGRTVKQLVTEAATRAFQEAGYRVVDATQLQQQQAIPVEIEIEKLWGWLNPGFWSVSLQFESELRVTGAVPGLNVAGPVAGRVKLRSGFPGTRAWENTIRKGLDDLVRDLRVRLEEGRLPQT